MRVTELSLTDENRLKTTSRYSVEYDDGWNAKFIYQIARSYGHVVWETAHADFGEHGETRIYFNGVLRTIDSGPEEGSTVDPSQAIEHLDAIKASPKFQTGHNTGQPFCNLEKAIKVLSQYYKTGKVPQRTEFLASEGGFSGFDNAPPTYEGGWKS